MPRRSSGVELVKTPTKNDRSNAYVTVENAGFGNFYNSNIHYHSFCELEFIIDGKGLYEINNVSHKACRGTLFLTTPADYHTYSLKEDEYLDFYNAQFFLSYINDEVASLLYSYSVPIAIQYTDEDCDDMIRKFEELRLAFEKKGAMYEIEVRNRLENLCISIIRDMEKISLPAVDHPMIKSAIIYVKEHYREDISLDEMAKHVGLSSAYFSHKFTEVVGMGFSAYLRQMRLSAAANLMKSTELSVKEICYQTGFSDPNYFSNAFRAQFGSSPRKYREEYKPKHG